MHSIAGRSVRVVEASHSAQRMDSLLMNGSIFSANFERAAQRCTLGGAGARVRNRTHCLRSFREVSSLGNGIRLWHLTSL
jgi:hypothetical protein